MEEYSDAHSLIQMLPGPPQAKSHFQALNLGGGSLDRGYETAEALTRESGTAESSHNFCLS